MSQAHGLAWPKGALLNAEMIPEPWRGELLAAGYIEPHVQPGLADIEGVDEERARG